MRRKVLYPIIIFFSGSIMIVISIFIISFNKKTKITQENIYISGIIEDIKITKEEQYLYIIDKNNTKWKVNIIENTIFKQKLKLEKGDKIIVKSKILDNLNNNNLSAIEISN